jgi:alanyl-tRNA synthetase
LFTTAGMHPLVPFLLGQKHPLGKRIVSLQKCIRTTDIDEVGDTSHHTFFEMLGNWSLGDYWKEDAIKYSWEFLTKILEIPANKISVTCFKGDKDSPKDVESEKSWKSLGIKTSKIKFLGKSDNWWGPAGETGPCGPDTEMFVNGFEIWNDVFMQYNKTKERTFIPLPQKNVDTGMGVERTLTILNNLDDSYETEVWKPIIKQIEILSGKKYRKDRETTRAMRIIADHVKASVFIISDGILPSNTGRGYVLRRLIRRAIIYGRKLKEGGFPLDKVAESVFEIYSKDYSELKKNKKDILGEKTKLGILNNEEKKFEETLEKGLRKFESMIKDKKIFSGHDAFFLSGSYGFPVELTKELAEERGIKTTNIIQEHETELKKHQELSRTASAGTFKSGLADHSVATTRLHTAAHLLNEALRQVLSNEIKQKGSNITSERIRFDFNFPRKVTDEEIKKVEELVNKKIKENLDVKREEMSLKKALKEGIQAEFGEKYPEIVSVYTIGNFSREICTGPHVKKTGELGKFRIIKEESVASGIRRIKAVLE